MSHVVLVGALLAAASYLAVGDVCSAGGPIRRIGGTPRLGFARLREGCARTLGAPFESRRTARAERLLVEALDAIAASLRSGSPPRRAIGEAAEVSPAPFDEDLAVVARALEQGEALEDALTRWSLRRPLPGVAMAVAVLTMGSRTGGDLARALEDVASTERHRRATREEVQALSAQARYSAVVVALAPVAFTGFAAMADPGVVTFLFADPLGWACLGLGLSLDLAGIAWMRAITGAVT